MRALGQFDLRQDGAHRLVVLQVAAIAEAPAHDVVLLARQHRAAAIGRDHHLAQVVGHAACAVLGVHRGGVHRQRDGGQQAHGIEVHLVQLPTRHLRLEACDVGRLRVGCHGDAAQLALQGQRARGVAAGRVEADQRGLALQRQQALGTVGREGHAVGAAAVGQCHGGGEAAVGRVQGHQLVLALHRDPDAAVGTAREGLGLVTHADLPALGKGLRVDGGDGAAVGVHRVDAARVAHDVARMRGRGGRHREGHGHVVGVVGLTARGVAHREGHGVVAGAVVAVGGAQLAGESRLCAVAEVPAVGEAAAAAQLGRVERQLPVDHLRAVAQTHVADKGLLLQLRNVGIAEHPAVDPHVGQAATEEVRIALDLSEQGESVRQALGAREAGGTGLCTVDGQRLRARGGVARHHHVVPVAVVHRGAGAGARVVGRHVAHR